MTAGVGAVIISVVYDMGKNVAKSKDWVNVVIMVISFCVSYFLKVNIISVSYTHLDVYKRQEIKRQEILCFRKIWDWCIAVSYTHLGTSTTDSVTEKP